MSGLEHDRLTTAESVSDDRAFDRAIRPKRLDSWYEAANLWGAIVGSPGVLKSPALNEALRPLRELESKAAAAHADLDHPGRVQQAWTTLM